MPTSLKLLWINAVLFSVLGLATDKPSETKPDCRDFRDLPTTQPATDRTAQINTAGAALNLGPEGSQSYARILGEDRWLELCAFFQKASAPGGIGDVMRKDPLRIRDGARFGQIRFGFYQFLARNGLADLPPELKFILFATSYKLAVRGNGPKWAINRRPFTDALRIQVLNYLNSCQESQRNAPKQPTLHFEANTLKALKADGYEILGKGEYGVAAYLLMPRFEEENLYEQSADAIGFNPGTGYYVINEGKPNVVDRSKSPAEMDHALSQLENTLAYLKRKVGDANLKVNLEISIPRGKAVDGNLAHGRYKVIGGLLYKKDGTQVIIGGRPVHVREVEGHGPPRLRRS